ncbi:uncharacterized protein TNCV_1042851 [Trichonephila clavipes]|nr:uncharacterized protein TNCV_1042851 [Trichonephila clavipes]
MPTKFSLHFDKEQRGTSKPFYQGVFKHVSPPGEVPSTTDFNIQAVIEDFGKRNMPGKRARRHFSRLSDFERGLIIGMKTAGWLTRRVAGQVDRSEDAVRNCWEQWTQLGTHAGKTGLK